MRMWRKIMVVLILAFLFRLFLVFCLPVRTFEDTIKRYHYAAVNIAEGRGYSHFNEPPYSPSFYKPPVYSIFLASIYKVFGVDINAARVAQCLLDTLGCFVLFLLLQGCFGSGIAQEGLLLAAFCPFTAVYTNLLNSESLTLFFMVMSLFSVRKAMINGKPKYFFMSGLFSSLMGYCRQEFFPLVAIFAAYLFFMMIRARKFPCSSRMLAYLLAVLMVTVPWIARNYRLTGEFIPLSAGGGMGLTLFHGTLGEANNDLESLNAYFRAHPDIKAQYDRWYDVSLYSRSSASEQAAYDDFFTKVAMDNIKADPPGYVLSVIKNVPRVWVNLHADEFAFLNTQKLRLFHPDWRMIVYYARSSPKEIGIYLAKFMLLGINLFYLAMAVAGLWSLRKRIFGYLFALIPLIYAQIFFLFIHISPNYTVPYWPCIIFFAAVGVYSLRSSIPSSS